MKKKNEGITLIALIITIIVMLILVAVTINMAVNGGLFGYAGNAARDTKTEKQKEEDWTNPGENLSSDELIEFYTSQPKDWIIGWVYKNGAWSNPYFKDKELENSFTFGYTESSYARSVDTRYSLNSENEVTGQLVVKLYNNGELNISGNGEVPNIDDDGGNSCGPWFGGIHWVDSEEGYDDSYRLYSDDNLLAYLNNHISKIVFEEGITSIQYQAFYGTQATDVKIPSTMTEIDFQAFRDSAWLDSFEGTSQYYKNGPNWYDPYVVDYEDEFGRTWTLAAYYPD